MGKRIFDIIFSLIALIIFTPVIIIFSLVIKSTFGSPVLFYQLRPGLNGNPFKMIKFRTMLNLSNADGQFLSDEKRLTKLGKFMRQASLDELPELWNVLKGDMSLVGPRPLLLEYLPLYNDMQKRRHEVKPGITGWAQINGRNAISWETKFEYDVWYIDNQSFLLDIKILLLTVKNVFFCKNITADGHVTMQKFFGNK